MAKEKRTNKFGLPDKSKTATVERKVKAIKRRGVSKQSAIRIAKSQTPGAHK